MKKNLLYAKAALFAVGGLMSLQAYGYNPATFYGSADASVSPTGAGKVYIAYEYAEDGVADDKFAETSSMPSSAFTGYGDDEASQATFADGYAYLYSQPAEGYGLVGWQLKGAEGYVGHDNPTVGYFTTTSKDEQNPVNASFVAVFGKDYTSAIANADLSSTDNTGNWNLVNTKGIDASGIVKVGSGKSGVEMSQVIKNLPVGRYRLTAQAAYRYGSSEQDEYDAMQDETINTKLASLNVVTADSTYSTPIQNRCDAYTTDSIDGSVKVADYYFIANSSAAVKARFDQGYYKNEVEFEVTAAGDVTISITKAEEASDYMVIGAWSLLQMRSGLPDGTVVYSEDAELGNWTKTDYEGVTSNGVFQQNTWSNEGQYDGTDMTTPFLEYWVYKTNGPLTKTTFKHSTITGLVPGLYTASLRVRAYNEANQNKPEGACLTVNGVSMELGDNISFTYNGMAGNYNEFDLLFEVGDDSIADVAFDLYEPNFNWVAFKGLSITSVAEYPEVTAMDFDGMHLNADTKANYENIIAKYQAAPSVQAYAAYQSAEYKAMNSINNYAELKWELAYVDSLKKHTDLTADSVAAVYKDKFEAGTIADEDIPAITAEVHAARKVSALSQTEAGSDMSVAFEDVAASLNGWSRDFTADGTTGSLVVNTWSVEGQSDGSSVLVPFIESWVGKGSFLSPAKLYYTLTGMQPGTYTISILARAYNEGSTDTPAGAVVFAGENEGDSIQTGTAFTYNNMAGVYGKYVIKGEVGEDGTLNVGFNLTEPNFNWFAVKSLNVVYDGVPVKTDTLEYAFESYTGNYYEGYTADVDMTTILAELGATSVKDLDIYAVMGDGTLDSNYKLGTTDGWRNAEGNWQSWGASAYYFSKVDFSAKSTQIYAVGGYPGNTNEVATYKAVYALTNKTAGAGEYDTVYVVVALNYVEAPEIEVEFVKTIDVAVTETAGKAYSEMKATFDVNEVIEALGVADLSTDNVSTYIVNTNDSLVVNSTDGWRDADGNAASWGTTKGYCVKLSDPTTGTFDFLGAYDTTYAEGDTFVARWAIVSNADNKAVVLRVTVNFAAPTAIDALEAGKAGAEGIYNIAGQKLNALQKGLNIVDGKKVYVK